jgi:hypothetical protein
MVPTIEMLNDLAAAWSGSILSATWQGSVAIAAACYYPASFTSGTPSSMLCAPHFSENNARKSATA